MAALALILRIPRLATPERTALYRDVISALGWILLLLVFMAVSGILQYLLASLRFPLIDERLLAVESAFGFHWPTAYLRVRRFPGLQQVLHLAYVSATAQLALIPAILAVTRRVQACAEFVVLFMGAVLAVLLISAVFPAESAFIHFHIADPDTAETVRDFDLLRSGALRTIDLRTMQGIVSFPSLHALLAVCFAYALRSVRYVRPVAVALNAAVIVSTPTEGGHYLLDVAAGLAIAWLLIRLIRPVFRKPAPAGAYEAAPSAAKGS